MHWWVSPKRGRGHSQVGGVVRPRAVVESTCTARTRAGWPPGRQRGSCSVRVFPGVQGITSSLERTNEVRAHTLSAKRIRAPAESTPLTGYVRAYSSTTLLVAPSEARNRYTPALSPLVGRRSVAVSSWRTGRPAKSVSVPDTGRLRRTLWPRLGLG